MVAIEDPTLEVENCIAADGEKIDEERVLVEGIDAIPDVAAYDGSDNDDS